MKFITILGNILLPSQKGRLILAFLPLLSVIYLDTLPMTSARYFSRDISEQEDFS